jgi:hypothetical protein
MSQGKGASRRQFGGLLRGHRAAEQETLHLVAAVPANERERLAEATPHATQQAVAAGTAERVVDLLEAVEVDDRDRQAPPLSLREGHGLPQPVAEQRRVGQPGDAVFVSERADRPEELLALGKVVDDPETTIAGRSASSSWITGRACRALKRGST